MKKLFTFFSAILTLTLVLGGCSEKGIEKKEEEFTKIEEKVINSVKSEESYAKEDIEKATTYIEENIDNVKDGTVAKKIAEYGYYLENIAKKDGDVITHDLATFGKEASKLAKNVYTAANDEKDEIIKDSEDTFKEIKSKLSEKKDHLIEEFHKLVNN